MLTWHGDPWKLMRLSGGCPQCGERRLSPLTETETMEAIVWCTSCGGTFEHSFTPHSTPLETIATSETPAVIRDTTITVPEIIELFEADWTRYEIADKYDISVQAVREALIYHLKSAGDAYDGEKFSYHFSGEGQEEWYDDWHEQHYDEPVTVTTEDGDDIHIEGSMGLLKHERRLQMSLTLVTSADDPRDIERDEIVALNEQIPLGYYRQAEEALVETAARFADYFEHHPET